MSKKRVITSHLQTHGYSVIIGKEEKEINVFIESLALFLEPKERLRSSFVVDGRGYVPDLILQGFLEDIRFNERDVIQTLMPTTIVYLHKKQVVKTCAYHEFAVHRKNYLRAERKTTIIDKDNPNLEPKTVWIPG